MGKLSILLAVMIVFGQCTSPAGKKFFDYDEINYYTIDFPEEKMLELIKNQSRSKLDSIKEGVILGSIPKDITDLSFINNLKKIGFRKSTIDRTKFTDIDAIFKEKSVYNTLATTCIYIYRDILIFKKEQKVIGTAKVCFDCWAHEITGTNRNTENFGQNGDYGKLKSLLMN
jgi:hypothetical protein